MKKISIALFIILAITSIGHALALPQASRCLFIDLYGFEKEEGVYFSAKVPQQQIIAFHRTMILDVNFYIGIIIFKDKEDPR